MQLQRVIDQCCIDYSHDVPHQQWLSPRANLDFAETLGAMITPHALYERPYMVLKLCVPVACYALAFMLLAWITGENLSKFPMHTQC